MPGDRGSAAVMVRPPRDFSFLFELCGSLEQDISDIRCRSRASLLIVYDPDFFFLLTDPQHGFDKITAMGAEDPTGPQDDMAV